MVEEESEMDDDGDDCISKEHKDVCESKCVNCERERERESLE